MRAHRPQGATSSSSTTRSSRSRPARRRQPGIVIIAGTGSIAYGRNARRPRGARRRLGLRARRRGQRLLDRPAGARGRRARARRRGPDTSLTARVLEHFGVGRAAGSRARDLLRRRAAVARLRRSACVVQAAATTAMRSRCRSSIERRGELAAAATSVAARLRLEACPVILSGGMFRAVPRLSSGLVARLRERRCRRRRRDCSTSSRRSARCISRSRWPRATRSVPAYMDWPSRCCAWSFIRPAEAASLGLAHFLARTLRRVADARARPADRPHADSALPRARAAAPAGPCRLRRATTFNLDEFVGLSPRDPRSYRAFMRRICSTASTCARADLTSSNGTARDMRREVRTLRAPDRARPAASTCCCSASAPTATSASTSRRRRSWRGRTASTLRPATRRANACLFDGDARRVPRARCRWASATILQRARGRAARDRRGRRRDRARALTGPVTTRCRRRCCSCIRTSSSCSISAGGAARTWRRSLRTTIRSLDSGTPAASRSVGSRSSPSASRIESSALAAACAAPAVASAPAFFITIAALTFHFASLEQLAGLVGLDAGDDRDDAARAVLAASRIRSARRPSGCRRSCRCGSSRSSSAC